jgi:integrase/recombinase XerC
LGDAFYTTDFWNYLSSERRFSAHTLVAYQNDLNQFIQFCQDIQCLTAVSAVRHLHIRAWMVAQLQDGISTRTLNRRLSCLKTYFKFLKKQGHYDHQDPMKKIVAPKSGKRLPVFIPESQMTRLFNESDFGTDYKGQLDRLVLEILYATGMRRSELTQLTVRDTDLSRGVFRVLGKGNKERLCPFAPYLREQLETFLALRAATFPSTQHPALLLTPKGQPLKPEGVYYIVKRYLSLLTTVEQRSPHVLRHSFATHLSDRGADLNAIKTLLGHANLAATQVYTHNSVEKLKKVYEQAHPKGGEVDEQNN